MGWRSVVIANPASLTVHDKALSITQGDNTARVMLEDISVLVLEHAQINLTASLLSACAEAGVAVLTVNASHLPNGALIPYLPHSRGLKVMTAQLELPLPLKKRLWQRIVRQKINNQAALLIRAGKNDDSKRLLQLAGNVRSGDPDNNEAKAAQLYFRALYGPQFHRNQERFFNSAMNYGYAVVRAAIARTLTVYGFLPAFGLFHHSEQNPFNLADDIIEPYRPIVDSEIISHFPEEPHDDLEPPDKVKLVSILHGEVVLSSHLSSEGRCTLLAAVEATVSGLSSITLQNVPIEHLALPYMECQTPSDNEP
jgi:CRISPR-associated protein Cas1